jgi:hypothetical protein
MARRVFFSFHYEPDNWRASKVRNMGVLEGNRPATDNDWETITKGGAFAIERWIKEQMDGKSCLVVLIGANTANRKWISYEIDKAWKDGKGVLGIHIYKLLDREGKQSTKGTNPFYYIKHDDGTRLSSIVKDYDSNYQSSEYVYNDIKQHFAEWVEESIRIRNKY